MAKVFKLRWGNEYIKYFIDEDKNIFFKFQNTNFLSNDETIDIGGDRYIKIEIIDDFYKVPFLKEYIFLLAKMYFINGFLWNHELIISDIQIIKEIYRQIFILEELAVSKECIKNRKGK